MKKIIRVVKTTFLLLGCLLYSLSASPATFNLFSPATGILKGSTSTYVTSAAASSDVIATFSGTCNSTTFMRADGSCQVVSSATGANPSASVGLTAVNGSAGTFMRSDGAPALSQAIVPTWTGIHTWTLAEPRLIFNESDQGSNKKIWDIDVQGAHFIGRTRTDADGAGKIWVDVARGTTTAISSITFGNASDALDYTFNTNGGLAVFSGSLQVSGTLLNVNAINGTQLVMGGSAAGISGCTATASTGGQSAGKFTSGTTGVCTVTITLISATNGYSCYSSDITTGVAGAQSASATNSCTIKVTTTTGDIVTWAAIGW